MRSITWLCRGAALSMSLALFAFAAPVSAQCLPPWVLQRPPLPDGLAVDPPIDTAAACPAWRWVAVKRSPGQPCPGAGEALFQGEDLPPALQPFCLYEATTLARREALEQSLERFVRGGDLLEVESGCAAVSPTATETTSEQGVSVWQSFRDHFLDQAGLVRSPAVALEVKPRVRLALLDTRPGDGDGPWSSDHGPTLGRMAQRLVCEGPGETRCAARIVHRLALPISELAWDDPEDTRFDWDHGGFFGTIDQLAQAVWAELETWEPDAEPLVLNLSVAWVGERFGGLEQRVRRMPVPVRALYRTLEVASCRGALVVAAAGNRIGGPEVESGPLLPGGWERRRAPTARECAELLGEEPAEPPGEHEPLVYAAAGIRTDRSPLVNARPGSEPPRVAYADHAVVAGDQDGSPTDVLTGSSVATVVVASAAAVVWHHRPELRRAEVMDLLWRSGESLGRTADVHLGRPAPEVRRITVCDALELACGQGKHCPGQETSSCLTAGREPPELPRDPSCTTVSLADAQRIDAATFTGVVDGNGFCTSEALRFDSGAGHLADPCPLRQFFAIYARPWTGPQPQSNPCSGCDIRPPPPESLAADPESEGGFRLRIDIDPDWSGAPLEGAVLDLGEVSFGLGLEPLEAGDCAIVEGLDPALFEPDVEGRQPPAVVYFRTAYGSIESPLFIGR